ncbi:MAG: signal peptidase II [Rhodobacteraceae bacterium]|nr:signal peptidase II [Paracoccaceae bacterium]
MRLATGVALGVITLDQGLKVAVVDLLDLRGRLIIEVWPPFLTLRMAWNEGVNFGLLASGAAAMRWILVAVALAIALWVWLWVRRGGEGPRVQAAAGLLIGGALGNVIDRLRWGAVADFLNLSCCGIANPFAFNAADVAVFAGALGLVLFAGRGPRPGA